MASLTELHRSKTRAGPIGRAANKLAALSFVLQVAAAGLAALIAVPAPVFADAIGTTDLIAVDCAKPTGQFKALHRFFSGGFEVMANRESLRPYLRDAGVSMLRVPVFRQDKMKPLFKGVTLQDASDPAMYDFKMMDFFASHVNDLGLEIFATLAEMPTQLAADGADKGPPKDAKVYAEVVRHVILHLTQGWANGYRYPIRYWEIWNEPDLSESPAVRQAYWTGSREQFFAMFAEVARTIKSIQPLPGQPEYKVGGPAFAHVQPWTESFLEYCNAHEVPLDFFSFHHYDDDARGFAPEIQRANGLLRKHPRYRGTELILNEWNMAIGPWGERPKNKTGMDLVFYAICNPKFSEPRGALHMARALMQMERSPLSKAAHFLLADNGVSTMGVVTCPEIPMPPKNPRVTPGAAGPKMKYHVLRAFEMLAQTPQLVSVGIAGNQFDALAGVSADRNRMTILLANAGSQCQLSVRVENLPWTAGRGTQATTFGWEQFVLDPPSFEQRTPLRKTAAGKGQGSNFTERVQVSDESVVILRLTRNGGDASLIHR